VRATAPFRVIAEEPELAEQLASPRGLDLVIEMAHDLRSPLSSILVLAESLQSGQGGPVTDAQRQQLGLIYSAALRLCASASDVVELARGGDRLVDPWPTEFSVSEVLRAVRDMVRPIAKEKKLTLRLAPPANDLRLGHPRALSRTLLNLTTNALKFTEKGFVEISARETTGNPDRVEFAVRDTGPGIPPAGLRHIYQPFRDAQGTGRQFFSGSGLGLAICRKLVQAMNSTLLVESRPTWGTRFHFTLDLERARQA